MAPIVLDSPAGTGSKWLVCRTADPRTLPEKQRASADVHRRDDGKDQAETDRDTENHQTEAGGRRSLSSILGGIVQAGLDIVDPRHDRTRHGVNGGGGGHGPKPHGDPQSDTPATSYSTTTTSETYTTPTATQTAPPPATSSNGSSPETTATSTPTTTPTPTPTTSTSPTAVNTSGNTTYTPPSSTPIKSTTPSTSINSFSAFTSPTSVPQLSGTDSTNTIPLVTSSSPSTNPPKATPTPPGAANPSHSTKIQSNHNNAAKIAGGAVGGLCVVILIIVGGIWFSRRRRRHAAQLYADSPRNSAFMSEQTTTQWSTANSLGPPMVVQSTTNLDGHRFTLFDDVPSLDPRTFLNINPPASYQANRRSWDRISAESRGERPMVTAQSTEEPDISRNTTPVPSEEQKALGSAYVDAVVADIMQTVGNRKTMEGWTSGIGFAR